MGTDTELLTKESHGHSGIQGTRQAANAQSLLFKTHVLTITPPD